MASILVTALSLEELWTRVERQIASLIAEKGYPEPVVRLDRDRQRFWFVVESAKPLFSESSIAVFGGPALTDAASKALGEIAKLPHAEDAERAGWLAIGVDPDTLKEAA